MKGSIAIGLAVLGLAACASQMTPAQMRAVDAFNSCRQEVPSAQIQEVREDGSISYSVREASHYYLMKKCLEERFGYRSRN